MTPMTPRVRVPVTADAASAFAGVDVCETAGFRVRPDELTPNYDDDVWDLTVLADAPRGLTRSSLTWDFGVISKPRWRHVAKDVALAFLAPRHPDVVALPAAFRTPRSPATVDRYLRAWTLWLNWLTSNGIESLAAVTSEHCDTYLEHCRWSRPRPGKPARRLEGSTVKNDVKAVQVLALYGGLLRHDRYAPNFVPWDGRSAAVVAGHTYTGENTTQPLGDDVLRPLLANALYHVEVMGPHVADLVSQVRDDPLHGIRLGRADRVLAPDDVEAFHALVDRYDAAGTPLPRLDDRYVNERLNRGWAEDDPLLTVHIRRLIREIYLCTPLHAAVLAQVRPRLEAAVARVGVQRIWARDAAMVGHAVTGEMLPWTLPLDAGDVHRAAGHVMIAALIVTAALTGMRRSELLEISPGARRAAEIAPGRHRYRIASRLIKGRPFGGVNDEWVVVEEVHRAIGLAERLSRAQPDEPLFGNLAISSKVDNFRSWCSEPAAGRLGLAPIPAGLVNGRMLRRTLALEIATRPHGLLAAKVHLKHLSVVTTEGYAARPGGSQAVFRAEIEDDEHRHHLDLTRAAYEQYAAGKMPTGPGARDLIAAFRHVDDELGSPPGAAAVLDNDRRVENLLRHQAATLHIGFANYCWFTDPAKALCLRLAGSQYTDRPIIGMCDSSRCPQATHHPEHRQVWQDAADTVKTFLGNPLIPKPERQRLQAEYDRSVRVIDAIDRATGPSPSEPA